MEGLVWDYDRYQTFLMDVRFELNRWARLRMATELCARPPLPLLFPLTKRQSCFPCPESIRLDIHIGFVYIGEMKRNVLPLCKLPLIRRTATAACGQSYLQQHLGHLYLCDPLFFAAVPPSSCFSRGVVP